MDTGKLLSDGQRKQTGFRHSAYRMLLICSMLVGVIVSTMWTTPVDAVPSVINLPGRFQAEDYKVGGEGVGYHDTTVGNSGGAYRTDNVDIQTCTDGTSCYNINYIRSGEWLAYPD